MDFWINTTSNIDFIGGPLLNLEYMHPVDSKYLEFCLKVMNWLSYITESYLVALTGKQNNVKCASRV